MRQTHPRVPTSRLNPAAEQFGTHRLYKSELVQMQRLWRTAEELEIATLMYVQWFNNKRLHGALSYRTPAEHEHAYYCSNHNQLTTI